MLTVVETMIKRTVISGWWWCSHAGEGQWLGVEEEVESIVMIKDQHRGEMHRHRHEERCIILWHGCERAMVMGFR